MRKVRSFAAVLLVAALVGVALGIVKGDHSGDWRGSVGNLSAPWVLLGLFAGLSAGRLRRGVVAGVTATCVGLVGFYVALTVALAGHLGATGPVRELAVELNANRTYFVFGICSGALAGLLGGWLSRRPQWATAVVGAIVAGELLVVAAVQGHQLLPRPVYFAWSVDDWRPYLAECAVGVALAAYGVWRRMRDSNSRGVAPNTLSKRAP